MTAGFQPSMGGINAQAATLCIALRTDFQNIQTFSIWLNSQPDAALILLGFAQEDVNALRTAFGDLAQLLLVVRGQAALPAPKDFRPNTILLTGGQ